MNQGTIVLVLFVLTFLVAGAVLAELRRRSISSTTKFRFPLGLVTLGLAPMVGYFFANLWVTYTADTRHYAQTDAGREFRMIVGGATLVGAILAVQILIIFDLPKLRRSRQNCDG